VLKVPLNSNQSINHVLAEILYSSVVLQMSRFFGQVSCNYIKIQCTSNNSSTILQIPVNLEHDVYHTIVFKYDSSEQK